MYLSRYRISPKDLLQTELAAKNLKNSSSRKISRNRDKNRIECKKSQKISIKSSTVCWVKKPFREVRTFLPFSGFSLGISVNWVAFLVFSLNSSRSFNCFSCSCLLSSSSFICSSRCFWRKASLSSSCFLRKRFSSSAKLWALATWYWACKHK